MNVDVGYLQQNLNQNDDFFRSLGFPNGRQGAIDYVAANKGKGAFNFDYTQATKDAYDSLGAYYKDLLDTYSGNVTKVIARLTQDYETGVRNNTQDAATNKTKTDTGIMDNALARGLYQRSNYDQTNTDTGTPTQPATQGFGIPTQNFQTANTAIDQGLQRYIDSATQTKERNVEDQNFNLKQKTQDLEQQKRGDAANIASEKASQAYNAYATAPQLA